MPESEPDYLGDSVYARYVDRGNIELSTNNGEGPDNIIFLEPAVYLALTQWVKHQKEKANGTND